MKLTRILNNSIFSETTNPNNVFISEELGLVAIANSFHTQWSAIDISLWSNSLLVYDLNTLELINKLENIDYSINDIAFHPSDKTILIGIGSYDGGYLFEGSLLLWNYSETNKCKSILKDNREVIKCKFLNSNAIEFTLNPTDDLDCTDFTEQTFEINYPINNIITLKDIQPISKKEYNEEYDLEEHKNQQQKANKTLIEISSKKGYKFIERNLIWDIKYINSNKIAIARNNGIVEIWNTKTNKLKEIELSKIGDCVEIFFNSTSNELVVNVWSREYEGSNTNGLYKINLENYEFSKILNCSHTFSKNIKNYFLARQIHNSKDDKKDFILNDKYEIIKEISLGHYDLFNHYIRIDNSDLLYYLIGNPRTQHQNKTIYSYNISTQKSEFVWELEQQPQHYNNLKGLKINNSLIISGEIYHSSQAQGKTKELFCIDLQSKKIIWKRTTNNQVSSFAKINDNKFVVSLTNGTIEIINLTNGKTVDMVNLNKNIAFDKPLSIDATNEKIIIGLVNGKLLEYEY